MTAQSFILNLPNLLQYLLVLNYNVVPFWNLLLVIIIELKHLTGSQLNSVVEVNTYTLIKKYIYSFKCFNYKTVT